jgi:xanthine dehydrogenase YagT iron-sulfur-binding subunit
MSAQNQPISPTINPLPIGSLAPDLFIDAGCGIESKALSQFKGQVVVLAFSRPGWDPARGDLIDAYNRVLDQVDLPDIRLIAIDHNEGTCRLTTSSAPTEHNAIDVPLMTGIDSFGQIAMAYGVHGKNALFVVDELGKIVWSFVAPNGALASADQLRGALVSLKADQSQGRSLQVTRRQFVAAALATAFAVVTAVRPQPVRAQGEGTYADLKTGAAGQPTTIQVTLNINGSEYPLKIDSRETLLDALREQIGLTGTKKGCDHGQCGACTVHMEGRRINSCLTLAAACRGKKIVTIEGLADGEKLHPVQAAFIEHDGFQCGYCTPGQIMSAAALLSEPWGKSDADVREGMSGNICRCGAYPNIIDAIQDVRGNRTGAQIEAESEAVTS